MRSNALDVIVLDSVAALVTKQELEGEIGDSTVGAQARRRMAEQALAVSPWLQVEQWFGRGDDVHIGKVGVRSW